MISNQIVVVTVLYYPEKIFYKEYKKLLELGFGLDIWCNSNVSGKLSFEINDLSNFGASVYTHYKNYGISKILNTYFLKKKPLYLFFVDQDTQIEPLLFKEQVEFHHKKIIENALIYFYSYKKPKVFFTNSGALFNLNKICFLIDKSFFVELVDYYILFKLLEGNLPFQYIESSFIDHYSKQNNYNTETKKKHYSKSRKTETIISSFRLLYLVLFSSKLSFNQKMNLIPQVIANVLKVVL